MLAKLSLLFLVGLLAFFCSGCDGLINDEEEPEVYSVTLQVLDFEDNPLEGIEVSPLTEEVTVTTDEQGKATLTQLEGEVRIAIIDAGEDYFFENKKVTPDDDDTTITVFPKGPYSLTLEVEHEGEPLAGIGIDGPRIDPILTDEEGQAVLEGLVGEASIQLFDLEWHFYFTSLIEPLLITPENRETSITREPGGTIENALVQGTLTIAEDKMEIVAGEDYEVISTDGHPLNEPQFPMMEESARGTWPPDINMVDYELEVMMFKPFADQKGIEELFIWAHMPHPDEHKAFLGVYGVEEQEDLYDPEKAKTITPEPDQTLEDIDISIFIISITDFPIIPELQDLDI